MYSDGSGTGVANARQLQGKELSYNNIVDLQAAWDLAQEFDDPYAPLSSTPILRERQPLKRWSKPTKKLWKPIRYRPSVASLE